MSTTRHVIAKSDPDGTSIGWEVTEYPKDPLGSAREVWQTLGEHDALKGKPYGIVKAFASAPTEVSWVIWSGEGYYLSSGRSYSVKRARLEVELRLLMIATGSLS